MINLDDLRRQIAAAPAEGVAATVDRNFLEQVHREISAGRAAEAQLRASRCMAEVIGDLGKGATA